MFSQLKSLATVTTLATLTTPALAATLNIKSFTAGPAGFHVTSHLISGERDAILVDAQFTRSEATKLAEMISSSGKKLTTVYITHGHPDHYFGAEVLRKKFPEARFISSPDVVSDIAATGAEKQKTWKEMYKDDLTDTVPVIESSAVTSLYLEGQEIRIVKMGVGESQHANVLYVPSLKTAITGDALFQNVHLWLAEGHLDGYKANLKALQKLGAKTFLAGHSTAALGEGKSLLDVNRKYVGSFEGALKSEKSADNVATKIKKLFPTFQLPIIADIAAKALFPVKKDASKSK